MIALLLHRFFRTLPPSVRELLKKTLAATGHRRSILDNLRSSSHASGKKRFDRVALTVIQELNNAGISDLFEKRCMEFGAGYVPTEVLVYFALGCSSVVAVDYNRIANLSDLSKAFRLLPLDWERSLDSYHASKYFNTQLVTKRIGIKKDIPFDDLSYLAPFDMSSDYFSENPFDFIHSVSVLEHLPLSSVQAIVTNLCKSLVPGGRMVNTIDLTDHWDVDKNPFGFLHIDTSYQSERDSDARGNRLRLTDWLEVFSKIRNCNTICVAKRSLPLGYPKEELLEIYRSQSLEEISLSEITLLTTRVR